MNFGILVTHPLFISVGLMLDMPLNILYDTLYNHYVISGYQIIGSIAIISAFAFFVSDFSSKPDQSNNSNNNNNNNNNNSNNNSNNNNNNYNSNSNNNYHLILQEQNINN